MVGFVISFVIGSVDSEVGSIDVIALYDRLKDLWMMNGSVIFEVYLLVLYYYRLTFVFTPKSLN